ncbi:MAG: cation diffusion facilitator family transporter [Bacteroidota bacterium]|jgi:cation diffusion facilitator family transporter|nr:MAG: cation diffusion facilitator family transporter [Bacteroidota bacterium]
MSNLNASQKNIQVQKWVAALSVFLLLVKLYAWYRTGSVAILGDALETIINVVAGFLGLYSLTLSAKPRDEDHPYGHGKIEYISAGIEGTLIFIAGISIIYESIRSLLVDSEITRLGTGLALVSVSAVLNYIAGTVCIRIGKKNRSLALVASGKHLHSDAVTTVGIVVGLFFVYLTDYQWIDGVIAILFSIWLLYTGVVIVRRSIAGIMDERDLTLLQEVVKTANANRRASWVDLHNVRFIKYGRVLHLDAHLTVPWYLNIREAHDEVEAFHRLMRARFDMPLEFFIHVDACMEFSCPICIKSDCPVRRHPFEKRITWTLDNITEDSKHRVEKG